MTFIITDSEYTTWPGALESGWAEPWQHREIFQMGAVRTDENFEIADSFLELIIPTINPTLSPLSQQLTGVSQLQLEQHGISFREALKRFVEFAGPAPQIICMNRDSGIFRENCELNGIQFPFQRDFYRVRPFLERQGIDLKSMSSGELHRLTPTPIIGHTHDALHDCRSMCIWLKHAREAGIFHSLNQLPVEIPLVDPRSRQATLQP